MSDTSLAIVEKKPRRPGCVGIFFQLFDWNRRFAKKKLFSKKLLPPARVKQATKKFGGDEKLPKLRLIANENSGGFPNAKNNESHMVDSEKKHGVRNPSLVARLMGLESMPVVKEDKLKKVSSSENRDENLEKGGVVKNEVRPEKLQRTGEYEGRAVTRFGAEAFQFKNVLSRSRKHNPKLPTPIKSPKSISTRNGSRLIGAATRILEPGLQARSRAKCALTYSKSIHHALIDESILEATTSTVKSLKGHSSCRNCGNLQDIVETRPYVEEREKVIHKTEDHFRFLAPQALDKTQMPLDRQDHIHWHLTSQSPKPQKDPASTIHSKHKNQRQNQVSPGRVPPRSKFNNRQSKTFESTTNVVNDTKDFVSLNRKVSGRIRSRMPGNVDNIKFDTYRKFSNRRDDSLSPVRKRRSTNSTRQSESSSLISSSFDKRQNLSPTSVMSRLAHLRDSNRTGGSGKDSDVISLIYSSPMKHQRATIPEEKEKRRPPNNFTYNSPSPKKSLSVGNDGKKSIEKPFVLTGDTLGALIEQKLKELNFQGDDEMGFRGTPPKRTSAIILQELICALTAESPYPQDDATVSSNGESISCYHSHISNPNTTTTSQAKPKTEGASNVYVHDTDHLSPGSVLEAPFSNDSCFSSSLDDNSGQKLVADPLECFYNEPQPLDPDADLLDSASSFSNGKTGEELMIDIVSHIFKVLSITELAGTKLKGIKLTHTKEVILNTELLFRNSGLRNSVGTKDFTICHFLIDEMETLASVMWSNFSCFLGFDDSREGNVLTGFLFDSVIEYLESRYGQCCNSGYKRLPLCINGEMLIWEVVEEVRRWTSLAGLIPDEIIEREMSCCLGKWTNFDIEAFETGVEIGREILESLVDEIVVDICGWIPC